MTPAGPTSPVPARAEGPEEPDAEPILQLHLSRHCNLRCRHCYSLSGPRERGGVPLALLPDLFGDAQAAGYRIASFSGGEPLLDPDLCEQVRLARRAGLKVNLVTNGMLIDARRADWIARHIDLAAVSLDGPADLHDALRARPGAFDKAVAGLGRLRAAGAKFGVIHTATTASLPHLRWLAHLAKAEGAKLLQVHPLEDTGRARSELRGDVSADLASRAAFLVTLLRHDIAGIGLHVDAVPRAAIACLAAAQACDVHPLAKMLDPLVIEPDGTAVPWTYGISRRLRLGNLHEARLEDLLASYATAGLDTARAHRRQVAQTILAGPEWPFVAWFAALAQGTAQGTAPDPYHTPVEAARARHEPRSDLPSVP